MDKVIFKKSDLYVEKMNKHVFCSHDDDEDNDMKMMTVAPCMCVTHDQGSSQECSRNFRWLRLSNPNHLSMKKVPWMCSLFT